jgi:exopolysaccharide production protein ExoZ
MIKTLQAGRAIAALSVVAFHLSIMMGLPRYGGVAVFREYTSHGNRGVDFFFVLSGFIILFAHVNDINRPAEVWRYIYRRLTRLYPIYWIYTVALVVLIIFLGGTDANMPSNVLGWATTFSLIRFSEASPPLSVAWTLFHEIFFYLVFATLIINLRMGLIVFAVVSVISIVLFQFPPEHERTPFYVYTSAYNLYFVIGMGAFWLYKKGGFGLMELFVGAMLWWAAEDLSLLPQKILPLIRALAMAFMLVAATKLEASGKLVIPSILTLVGDASYTIYLTHLNLEGVILKAINIPRAQSFLGAELSFLLVMCVTVAAGCVGYIFVEKPLIDAFRRAGAGNQARQSI